MMVKKTVLFQEHQQAQAMMVDFFGWKMPLHYGSALAEHQAVRDSAGIFDVSHMTIVDLLGAGGRQFLRYLLANDIDRITHSGRAMYSCMLNNRGGIIDDLMVYVLTPDHFRLVLNSATRENDLKWLRSHANDNALGLQERPELAMIAVQGPKAQEKLLPILNSNQMDVVSTLQAFELAESGGLFIARTGYTGEAGFELIMPQAQAQSLWQGLRAQDCQVCGLAARDSLRLEAGLLLYGQDMDEHTTPLECGLAWTVSMKADNRDFIGKAALKLQQERGVARKLVGLILSDKGVMRAKQRLFSSDGNLTDESEGIITSGGYSPSLKCSIALASVPKDFSDTCLVEIRGKMCQAQIVKPRFVKDGQILVDLPPHLKKA